MATYASPGNKIAGQKNLALEFRDNYMEPIIGGLSEQDGYTEKAGYKPTKRLRRKLLSYLNLWHRKKYDVRFASVGDARYKKVTYNTSARAEYVWTQLSKYGQSPHFPAAIDIRGCEIWLEFIEGTTPSNFDATLIDKLSDFYASIYTRDSSCVPMAETQVWTGVVENLALLLEMKLVSHSVYKKLYKKAEALVPQEVWVGFDYTDPIANNLVITHNKQIVCAVDIKNLHSKVLLGQGIAKAQMRWLTPSLNDQFIDQLVKKGAPDFSQILPFINLVQGIQCVARKARNGKIRNIKQSETALSRLI